ncbi:MAG: flagellar filament capping protein FliD [Candidatus Kapabacteria bacterium]|nr:flagellar filament capping protein FliD [Candidatus Kapabacteria bacterium]
MSDSLALGSNLSSNSSNSQTEQIAVAYRNTQKYKLDAIKKKQDTVSTKQKIYSNLNSKMNNLVSAIDNMSSSTASDKFKSKKVVSSNTAVATASASADSVIGVSSLKVDKLAVNDRLISNRLNLADSFGVDAGENSFEITVNGVIKKVSVTFDGSETNEKAFSKVTKAINLTTDVNVSASFVKDTSTTGRLILTSSNTGSDYKISFSDSSVLNKFGINNSDLNSSSNRSLASDKTAGYSKSNSDDLNAKAILNGINVVSSSNTLDNVLSGVKITLLKAQDASESEINLTTDIDTATVKDFINPILTSYNDILSLTKADKNTRRSDSGINNLSNAMRSISSQKVSSVTSSSYEYLGSIGIKSDKNGALSIADETLFTTALKEDANRVIDLFSSSDGFVSKVNSAISTMKGDEGLIKSRTLSLSTEANNLKNTLTSTTDQINRQAAAVKKQYEQTLKTYLQAQSQYSSFSGLVR